MPKLLYIAPRDFPRRVANRVQTIKMAEAFSQYAEVTLVVSKLHSSIDELWEYYDVKTPFNIKVIGEPIWGPQSVYSLIPSIIQILKLKPDILYFREELIGWLISWFKRDYIYEMLDLLPRYQRYYPRLVQKSKRTIVISQGLKNTAINAGLNDGKIQIRPDAVDLNAFDIELRSSDARSSLGLDPQSKLVVYSGRFSSWKGTDTLIESAKHLPDDVNILLIGGFEGEPEKMRTKISECGVSNKVSVIEFQPHSEIPKYLKAADALVIPNKAENQLSVLHTSPLKLFEYMASKRPIIASDLPSIREILDESSATFVQPDSPEDLAIGIINTLKADNTLKVENAFKIAEENTWKERARLIIESALNS